MQIEKPLPQPKPSPGSGLNRLRWVLPIILACYLLFAGLHAALVPVGQTGYQDAPDEAAHVNFVRVLAQGRLPSRVDSARDKLKQSYEWHQPPLYYLLCVPFLDLGVHALRWVSIVIGLLNLLMLYMLADLVFPEQPRIRLLATAWLALLPGQVAIASSVNNDILLELCFTTVLYLLMVMMKHGLTTKRAIWLGVVLGASLIVKATALLLLPLLLFGAWLLRRAGEKPASIVRSAVIVLTAAFFICGWWYIRNDLIYHEALPVKEFNAAFSGTAKAKDVIDGRIPIALSTPGWPGYALLVAQMSFQSFWAVYGTPRLARFGVPAYLPSQTYLLCLFITIITAAGMAKMHFQKKQLLTLVQTYGIQLCIVLTALTALSFAIFVSHYFQAQGRYLLPAGSAFALFTAAGWEIILPERYRSSVFWGMLIFMLLMSCLFLTAVQAAAG